MQGNTGLKNRNPLDALSEEEIDYYRENPDEIHELLNRETVRKKMIGFIVLVAVTLVTVSKAIPYLFEDIPGGSFVSDVVVDLIFEMGAALMGAVATLLFIEVTQARQYEENKQLYRALKAKLKRENKR